MGFSAQKYRREQEVRPWKINPIWRGIGCVLILLIPIMSWFAATLVLQSDQQIIRSASLMKPISIRYIGILEVDQVIGAFNRYTVTHNLLIGQFYFTLILMVMGFGILSVMYAIMYRVAGPPRYGPFDVPPDIMRR
ncbi:MAG: hypothetical protein A2Y53_09000 [Chloroflexi bacterium RBG_16_47_49]|nr:MAG: hypothetical protein A2Y53_09000 [Chloroflexi bacterium RBG_16_47_49]